MHLTTMSNTSQPEDTSDIDKTADLAKSSGLFASRPATTPPQTQPSQPAAPKTAKTPKQPAQTEKTPHNPPAPDLPCDSTDVNSPEIPANPAFSTLSLLDTGSVYDALRSSKGFSNSALYAVARVFVRSAKALVKSETKELIDRYSVAGQPDINGTLRARGDAPTREELIDIVSAALRAKNATGSDVKGLTATLQSLLPDLFSSGDQSKRPDPSAIIGYITTFAGRKGAEIVADLGGRESLETRLSEILGLPVKLGESAP